MKEDILIGCSSFNNRYWKGIFYPEDLPSSKWFEYYCRYFETYEINGTFYNFPRLKTLQDWFNKTPHDFLFSVKAPKLITHINQFINCEELLEDFYGKCNEGYNINWPVSYFNFHQVINIVQKNWNTSSANSI